MKFERPFDHRKPNCGYVIHGAIHEAKPELHCVIHTHSPASMAVSSLKNGLLPMTQMAMRFDKVAYHGYEGVALEMEERERLVRDLGESDVMFLRNPSTRTAAACAGSSG